MSQLQAMTFQQICYTEILNADHTVLLREWHNLTLNSLLYAKSALPNKIAEHIQEYNCYSCNIVVFFQCSLSSDGEVMTILMSMR
jgi:hypothetical protein